ncbi:MAG TPA: proline dehydrogenase family protein [Myxococcaceae bacterium]|nr:proline dehydrogenase family protein [Myxococcaceae bacterium]
MIRRALLAGSQNQWLAQRAPKYGFVRKAVQRFMPGEDASQAFEAARALQDSRIATILTQLGENVKAAGEADAVTRHYLQVLDRVKEQKLDAVISVKLTQLGLDLNADSCFTNVQRLVERAKELGNFVWIDMEGSAYTDATLQLYRRVRAQHANVGVCVQSYLYRTEKDLADLLPIAPVIRLVKGAYREPPALAYPRKKDVDANYFRLGQRFLDPEVRKAGTRVGFATHDLRLIQKIEELAQQLRIPKESVEFQLLYGIQRPEQLRLAQAGYRVRVLISYGPQWFPWYMRRLAERPANLTFLMRNLFSG